MAVSLGELLKESTVGDATRYQHQPTACTSHLSDYHRTGQKRAASCVMVQKVDKISNMCWRCARERMAGSCVHGARHERHRARRTYEDGTRSALNSASSHARFDGAGVGSTTLWARARR